MPYEIKPLACDPTVIKGMSERLIVSHYQNNYGGAVQRLNAITKELAELDFSSAPIFVINGLKREELIAMNSMILHEIFFASLGERGEPEGALRDALIRDFGSISAWAAEFSAMGKAQRGGSGWVLLTWSPRDRRLVNQWAMDHSTTLAGGQPILAMILFAGQEVMQRQDRRLSGWWSFGLGTACMMMSSVLVTTFALLTAIRPSPW
jgi:Fe-Mn family superoxide dismutase